MIDSQMFIRWQARCKVVNPNSYDMCPIGPLYSSADNLAVCPPYLKVNIYLQLSRCSKFLGCRVIAIIIEVTQRLEFDYRPLSSPANCKGLFIPRHCKTVYIKGPVRKMACAIVLNFFQKTHASHCTKKASDLAIDDF